MLLEMGLWYVAIDFSSRESCIAFSTKANEQVNGIHQMDVDGQLSLKKTRSILLDKKNNFLAFGDEAESMYEYESNDSRADLRLFRQFQNLEHTEGLVKDVIVRDTAGRPIEASTVLAIAIKHMADIFTTSTTEGIGAWCLGLVDVQWVLIVPTSWNKTAHKCIKVAATEAGLSVGQIFVIQDSEAASFMCRKEVEQTMEKGTSFQTNTKTLTVNWGYDRMDISVMETKSDGTLRIHFLDTVKTLGTDAVLDNLFQWLATLFDEGTLDAILEEELPYFRRYCQGKLKTIKCAGQNSTVTFSIPAALAQALRQRGNIGENRLRFGTAVARDWFMGPLREGIDSIKGIIEQNSVMEVVIYGEFVQNKTVVDEIRSNLAQRVIIPNDVDVAVLRGAVMYGRSPELVASRISRFTNRTTVTSSKRPHNVVAAIDFGTAYSGYAYCFVDNQREIAMSNWNSKQHLSKKAPTCILLNPQKQFHAFGYEAEDVYARLAGEDKQSGWMFFRQFKMMLHHEKELNRHVTVDDINGNPMSALTIFTMTIRYMKELLLKEIANNKQGVEESDIMFMLTIPAIWNDSAKQFMKESATGAGISLDRIQLVLEPEVAAAWCYALEVRVNMTMAKEGTQFMVVDLGGGTTDISVQEKCPDGSLKMINPACGGSWGGTNVDKAFLSWLESLFGKDIIKSFREEEMVDFLVLLRNLEILKRDIKQDEDKNIHIDLLSLPDIYKEKTGKDVDAKIKRRKITINSDVAKSWFSDTIEKAVKHVRDLFKRRNMQNVKTIILVGGFSECKLLQDAFKEALRGKDVFIPMAASVAVLYGAVMYGLKPKVISSRIMRCSYGLSKTLPFNGLVHDRAVARHDKSLGLVVDVFEEFIGVDDEVDIDEIVEKGFELLSPESTEVKIYSSTEIDTKYVSDTSCKLVGQVKIRPHIRKTETIYKVQFKFGKTEILVTIVHPISGEEYCSHIDCL